MSIISDESNNPGSHLQKIYKEFDLLTLNMNKKEDDIKNIITEKDAIINEMNEKIIKQKNLIDKNKEKIKKFTKRINEMENQLKIFKIFEEKVTKILKLNELENNEIKNKNLNKDFYNNNEQKEEKEQKEDNEENEDNEYYDDDVGENEDLFYDEYEDILDDAKIIKNQKINKKGNNKKKSKKTKKENNNNDTEDNNKIHNALMEKKEDEKDYILIGKTIINNNKEDNKIKKEKIYRFQNNIIKDDEHFYMLQKGLRLFFPDIKLNRLNFDLSGKWNKFPFDLNRIKENEDLLLNKDLLFIVETLDEKIIGLYLNKSYLPQKCFYLLFNEDKLYYYRKKKILETLEENEFYRDIISHDRYQFNKQFLKKIGDLKCFFLEGFFGPINKFDSLKCKEIEIFEILSDE